MSAEWKRVLLAAGLATALGLSAGAPMVLAADRDVPHIVDEAKAVTEASKKASYTAPAKGQVWLYDVDAKQPVHSITVNKNNTYGFDAKRHKLYVNSEEGMNFDLNADHDYRIYFVTAEARDARHDRNSDRNTERRAESGEKARVPDSAKVVMEGRDKELSYKATDRGTAYLWDNTNNQVVNSFNMDEGDRLTISPKSNAISLNGKTIVRDTELSRRVEYRLLFDAKK